MAIFPVILCGGAGTRLWPASRPARPKQFLSLTSDLSPYQQALLRIAPLADDVSDILVVAGAHHAQAASAQMEAVGLNATLMLEPVPRNSGPALAAAAHWVAQRDPSGIVVAVASDHHIPDAEAFRFAIGQAVEAAKSGQIVTLGITPPQPATAYGYIQPRETGLSKVAAFVEKPDEDTAQAFVDAGYLWNSGNFIVRADILIAELHDHAPAMADATRVALDEARPGRNVRLGDSFGLAPALSIDHAVMEKTDRISVLPVRFAWSDLGAWDAVAQAALATDGAAVGGGLVVAQDTSDTLIRAAPGMVVTALGTCNLAIVAERDAVLVCDLDRSQQVRDIVSRVGDMSPKHLDFPDMPTLDLATLTADFRTWMMSSALPLWATVGVREDGTFREAIMADGSPVSSPMRARVQARQTWVYARARAHGWSGPWATLTSRGMEMFAHYFRRPDGLFRTRVAEGGDPMDDTPYLYDQAFVLLMTAEAWRQDIQPQDARDIASGVRTGLQQLGHSAGGWREGGNHPFQANAHMHLLEAALAWTEADPAASSDWLALADAVVDLALASFIEPQSGRLREYFSADWLPAEGPDGRLIEPGHQFEWATLLKRYAVLRPGLDLDLTIERLFQSGCDGIDPARNAVMDGLDIDGKVRDRQARLWTQTEWVKAAGMFGAAADQSQAVQGLMAYLRPNGTWWDKMRPDATFEPEPAPASSLYHIMGALDQLVSAT